MREEAARQPYQPPVRAAQAPGSAAFSFLHFFFVAIFVICWIAFLGSWIGLANLSTSSRNYYSDSMLGTSLMVGSVLGALMSGIGWAITLIGRKLLNQNWS